MSELDNATVPALGPLWLWPDTDLPCDGAGIYYVTGISALGEDRYASTTLCLGETLPKAEPEAELPFPDYEALVDLLDRRFTVDFGFGEYRYLTNAAIIIKHCRDRRHADKFLSQTNYRPSVEWIASLAVVDDSAAIETLEAYSHDRFYERAGIWLPYSDVAKPDVTLEAIHSARGGDTAATYIALPDSRRRAHIVRRPLAPAQ